MPPLLSRLDSADVPVLAIPILAAPDSPGLGLLRAGIPGRVIRPDSYRRWGMAGSGGPAIPVLLRLFWVIESWFWATSEGVLFRILMAIRRVLLKYSVSGFGALSPGIVGFRNLPGSLPTYGTGFLLHLSYRLASHGL